MRNRVPKLEARESASPAVTRAVAAVLQARAFEPIAFPLWQKAALTLMDCLPRSVVRRLVRWEAKLGGLPARIAPTLTTDRLVSERLADYHDLNGDYDQVVVGASLGGAAAHLAAAMQAPYLPQPFITSFKGGSPDDSVEAHLAHAMTLADPVLRNNPDLMAISHFDPIHDGWLTRNINHLRLKLLDLPLGYQRFIRARLRPGGSVLYLDCGARWLRYRLGPRHILQIGGWGDIPPEEFLQGSERIDAFLAASGSRHRGGWALKGAEVEQGPESEWGSEPGLDAALQAFCEQSGYRFLRLKLPHPHDFSRLAFRAHQELCRRSGIDPQGVVVEIFTQYDPVTVLDGGLLPLWLIFNTHDSLAFLRRCLSEFPAGKPVFFSSLVAFSRTPDMVSWADWEEVLRGLTWINIGARPERYPEDPRALLRGPRRLADWVRARPARITARLSAQELVELAQPLFPSN